MDEGRIAVPGGEVWFRRLGAGAQPPLLMLHGGPGAGHDYLEPFAEAIATMRPVVLYDQLGCGRSDRPDDPSLWTLDRSCAEFAAVREALGLSRIHLLGQSWGGWLSIELLCRGIAGVASAVLASTSASIPQFVAAANTLIDGLPEPYRTALQDGNAAGVYDSEAYLAACDVFYRRHVCRLDPWPDAFLRTVENLDGNQVYETMNGPNEFAVIGSLRTWDRTVDLGRITLPTLITCGRHDEITPACSQTILDGVRNGRMVVFEQSAHCAHLEELDRYVETVEGFLREIESR